MTSAEAGKLLSERAIGMAGKTPAAPVCGARKKASKSSGQAAPPAAKRPRDALPAVSGADLQVGARLKHARLLAGVRMRELAANGGKVPAELTD